MSRNAATLDFGDGQKQLTAWEVTALRSAITGRLTEYQNVLQKADDPLTQRCIQDGLDVLMSVAAKIGVPLPR